MHTHKLYHEAQRRASQPQPVTKLQTPKALLLSAPNNIIFELFNTIVKENSSSTLLNYLKNNLKEYLNLNWENKLTQQAITRIKREQAIDHRAGITSAPPIRFHNSSYKRISQQSQRSPPAATTTRGSTSSLDSLRKALNQNTMSSTSLRENKSASPLNDTKQQTAVGQVYDHIMWRIQNQDVSQITSLLIKLVFDDGFKRRKLSVEAYRDVADCFQDWRGQKLIKLYAFGSALPTDQKLILSSTTVGDLTKWVANYIDGSEKKTKPETIRTLASALRDKTKNCIFITNDLNDAVNSIETGAIRCALVVDRLNLYNDFKTIPNFADRIETLLANGKLYIVSSLDCVEFAPDPTSATCC